MAATPPNAVQPMRMDFDINSSLVFSLRRLNGETHCIATSPVPSRLPLARPRRSPHIGTMCNDYEQHVRWIEYCKLMQKLALRIPTHQAELDLPQADDIKISDQGPVMRAAGDAVELAPMSFS